MTFVECVIHIVSDAIDDALISELRVGDTRPFSPTISNTCASHHVAHIMLFVPLVSNAIHDPFIGCTDFLVGSHGAESKLLVSVIVLCGSTPFHVVPPALRSTVRVVAVVVQEGKVAQGTIGISTSSLNQNSMVCTERIFLVLLIIGSCAAPEVSILPPFGRAGVESPAIVGEREDARLSIGVATVSLGYSCLLAADSVAQASAQHLLIPLCLQPLHPHRVNHTAVCDTVTIRRRLRMRLGLVDGRSDISEGARSCRCGLQGRMPLTLPLATAVAGADALEQVPPVVLLAPGIPNSIGCPSVLIVASVSGGASDTSTAFSQASTVHHHPALIRLFPGLPDNVGSTSSLIKTFLSYGLAGPFSFPITQTHTL